MLRSILRPLILILVCALAAAGPIGLGESALAEARSVQPQSGELLTNPGFEDPFSGGVANGWQPWSLTPDGVTYLTVCGNSAPDTCKPYGIPSFHPAQPQDARFPPHSISGNSQKWGSSYYVYIAGVLQQVGGIVPGTRLQFSANTQAFNCSNDKGCFGPFGRVGYSYEPGDNNLRVGIDPTGGTNPFSTNIVWSAPANPLDAFTLQSVEAVAQSDKVTVFVWSAPQYAQKHLETFVDNASLVATGQGAVPVTPTGAPTPASGTAVPDAKTYAVVAGDSLSAIAQRYGLTLDQLLALNPTLTRDSVIDIGQVINIAGTPPTPGAATPVPSATPQPSPTLAPTVTPTPEVTVSVTTTTPITPTAPTLTPAAVALSSGLCLQAFDDLNNNLVRDSNEALVAGVAFKVTSVDGKTSVDYTTDGKQEPHCFTTLPDGRYAVNTQLPASRLATTDSAWQMSLLAGTNVNIMLGTRLDAPPTTVPTLEPASQPTPAAATTTPARSNNSAPLALLGGGVLILFAGGALFLGLRSRKK